MSEEPGLYEVRSVLIKGVTAVWGQRAQREFTTVSDAAAADKALGDDGNEHHCPLCNEFYGTQAFATHAPGCIKAWAARWERQRDREPAYSAKKRFGKRLIVPGGFNGEGPENGG